MSNKVTAITSGGTQIPIYDKAAHDAITATNTYISEHEAQWSTGTTYTAVYPLEVNGNSIEADTVELQAGEGISFVNGVISITGDVGKTYTGDSNISINDTKISLNDTVSAKEIDLYGTSTALHDTLTFGGLGLRQSPVGIDGPYANYKVNQMDIYNPSNSSKFIATPYGLDISTTAECMNYTKGTGLTVYDKTSTNSTAISIKGLKGRASNAAYFGLSKDGLQVVDGQKNIHAGADGFAYTDFTNNMTVKVDSTNGLYQTYSDGGTTKTVYLKDVGQGGGKTYSGVDPIVVDNTNNTISADTADVNYQQIVHDDSLVHVSNNAQYALGVNLSAMPGYETVLWEGVESSSVTLSENASNFEKIKIEFKRASNDLPCGPHEQVFNTSVISANNGLSISCDFWENNTTNFWHAMTVYTIENNVMSPIKYMQSMYGATTIDKSSNWLTVTKVVGINRKEGN